MKILKFSDVGNVKFSYIKNEKVRAATLLDIDITKYISKNLGHSNTSKTMEYIRYFSKIEVKDLDV